ncbi:MAG: hypothetical protein FVQ85_06980 [Planctomycetes bacterium]|nr:hypothetical protein [Planctomycetota bacterium]
MNVNKVLIKDYEKKTLGEHGKNEPKTNPIKANTNPIKANIMPKQTQYEPKQTQFSQGNNQCNLLCQKGLTPNVGNCYITGT